MIFAYTSSRRQKHDYVTRDHIVFDIILQLYDHYFNLVNSLLYSALFFA